MIRSARLGMAPTLVTNALAAWATLGYGMPKGGEWSLVALVVLTGFCFFLYGMWENDRIDARWDARYRPNRPVPMGEVSVWSLRVASIIVGIAGLLLSSMLLSEPFVGVFLIIIITLYNWLHKVFAWSVVLMGFCRGMWVLIALLSFVVASGADMGLFGEAQYELSHYYVYSLTIYTIIVSWIARREARSPVRKKWASVLLPAMCLHDAVWLFALEQRGLLLIAIGCYGLVIVLSKMKHRTT